MEWRRFVTYLSNDPRIYGDLYRRTMARRIFSAMLASFRLLDACEKNITELELHSMKPRAKAADPVKLLLLNKRRVKHSDVNPCPCPCTSSRPC